ncbi:hypothetical protein FJZ53_06940 [Candidatus Woesearchaeota archaeon]|nr:hypothetical protein [Candidatus Woesearchaeota archaeon]
MAELKKTDSITLKIERSSWTDRKGVVHEGLSLREFVKSGRYTGPGKNGIFVPKELIHEFKKAIEAV